MEKLNQRIVLTKKLLKNGLIELLTTESIHKVSIKALCEHAGINRSTFYKYYGSQYDLLKEIELETVDYIVSILETQTENKANALCEICRYLEQNISLVKPLINNSNESEFIQMIMTHPTIQQEIYQSTKTMFDEKKIQYVQDYIIFGTARIIQIWINNPNRESADEIAELLANLMRL